MKRQRNAAEIMAVLPPGSRLVVEGRSVHPKIVLPTGEPLRDKGGMPIRLSSSPSDWRSRKNELARVRRALRERDDGRA